MIARTGFTALALTALLAAGLTAVAPAAAQRTGPPDGLTAGAAAAAAELLADDPNALVSVDPATGVAGAVRVGRPERKVGTPRQVAEAFLREHGELVGVAGTAHYDGTVPDNGGGAVVSFTQRFRGMRVFGGELRVRVADGAVASVHGSFVPDVAVGTIPTLAQSEAHAVAVRGVRRHAEQEVSGLAPRRTDLVVFRTGLLAGVAGENRLAYEVEVADPARTVRQVVYVDAASGTVLQALAKVQHGLSREVYEGDTSTASRVFGEGDPDQIPVTDANADKVQMWQNLADGARETYNLFASMTGRDSWTGTGTPMRSVARGAEIAPYCPNAWWNGFATVYCTGMDTDDIVAHEWGHAYTERTSGLVYAWQSGALNETSSDVWGEVVDLLNARGGDGNETPRQDDGCSVGTGGGTDPSLRWIMGEDAGPGPSRDMWNPVCMGLPGKVTDKQYLRAGRRLGPGRGAHQLRSPEPRVRAAQRRRDLQRVRRARPRRGEGGQHLVAGRAATDVDQPLPRLRGRARTSCASLVDAPLSGLSIESPTQVLSASRITSNDCAQLRHTIAATELRTNVADPTNPGAARPYLDTSVTAGCPEGQFTPAAAEDFEDGLGAWTFGRRLNEWNNPQPDWAITSTLPAGARGGSTKAAYAGFVSANFYNEAAFFLDSPALTIPVGMNEPRLGFDHWFYFHGGGIGGFGMRAANVKVSVNDGAWTLVPQSAWLRNGYHHTVPGPYPQNNYYPPLSGEPAWTNLDTDMSRAAWAHSVADLSALTEPGDTVRLRFDVAHDYNHFGIPAGAGWYVDNVALHSCTDATAPAADPWHFDRANADGWNNSPVTIRWRWRDGGSGIDPNSCTQATTVTETGVTTHTATCRDLAGNVGTSSYVVRLDTSAPLLTGPTPSQARQLEGLPVTVTFSAADPESGVRTTSCAASFAVDTSEPGTYTKGCSAINRADLVASASTSYEVISASTGITELIAQVQAAGLSKPSAKSLIALLENARKNRDHGKDADCILQLKSFVAQVNAQSGKAIPAATAAALAGSAERLIKSIQASPSS